MAVELRHGVQDCPRRLYRHYSEDVCYSAKSGVPALASILSKLTLAGAWVLVSVHLRVQRLRAVLMGRAGGLL